MGTITTEETLREGVEYLREIVENGGIGGGSSVNLTATSPITYSDGNIGWNGYSIIPEINTTIYNKKIISTGTIPTLEIPGLPTELGSVVIITFNDVEYMCTCFDDPGYRNGGNNEGINVVPTYGSPSDDSFETYPFALSLGIGNTWRLLTSDNYNNLGESILV